MSDLPRVDGVEGERDERGDERLVAGAGRQQERLLHARRRCAAAVTSGSSGGELAGLDALAQQAGEQLAPGALAGQALGLDGRVDGLGHQRVDQRRARPARGGRTPPRRRPSRSPHRPRRGRRSRRSARARGSAARAEDLGEQLALGGEVAVDAAGGDAGAARDGDARWPRRSRPRRPARGRRRRSPRACGPSPRRSGWPCGAVPRHRVNHGSLRWSSGPAQP